MSSEAAYYHTLFHAICWTLLITSPLIVIVLCLIFHEVEKIEEEIEECSHSSDCSS